MITGALEVERREKRIGASLQAAPVVHVTAADAEAIGDLDMAELAITSAITLKVGEVPAGAWTIEDVPGVGVEPKLAEGDRCERCWQILPDVAPDTGLCPRCADVVKRRAA